MDQIMTAFADKSIDPRALENRAGELLFETQHSPKDSPLTFQQMDKMNAALKSKDTLHDALSVIYSFSYMGMLSRVHCEDLVGSLIERFRTAGAGGPGPARGAPSAGGGAKNIERFRTAGAGGPGPARGAPSAGGGAKNIERFRTAGAGGPGPARGAPSAGGGMAKKGEDVIVITEEEVPNSMQSVREARKVKLAEAKSKQAKIKYQTLKSSFDKTQPDIKSAKAKRVQIEADLARAVEAENALNVEYTRLVAEVSQAYAESQAAETAHEEAILAAARAGRLGGEDKRAKH